MDSRTLHEVRDPQVIWTLIEGRKTMERRREAATMAARLKRKDYLE